MKVPNLDFEIALEEYLTEMALGTHLHNPQAPLGSDDWYKLLQWSKKEWRDYYGENTES